ncbi:uncharacterized protein LOC131940066 [Physella acuta]|uniref:uncharacterized protein LOC131940066 n=1 Tax=Physella acuta TaxID=109671 RepID=UPI0027DC9533|nr:uncharacterized protein LOC131940066 [Physella acuta]
MNNSTTNDVILQDDVESNQGKWQHLDWLQGINNSANIPSFVLLSVLTICGVFGNSLILMVYSRKVNKTPTVTLIQVIAFVDLMTNVLVLAGTISAILDTKSDANVIVCKVYYLLNTFTASISNLLLVIVAVIRHRKICRPLHRQITTREARIICACAMGLSFLFSIPSGILYGLVLSKSKLKDRYRYNCGIADQYSDTIWPKLYSGFYVLVVMTSCIILSTLYILIGLAARRHFLRMLEVKSRVDLCSRDKIKTPPRENVLHKQSSKDCGKDQGDVGLKKIQATNYDVVTDNSNQTAMDVKNINNQSTITTTGALDVQTVVPEILAVETTTHATKPEVDDVKPHTRAVKSEANAVDLDYRAVRPENCVCQNTNHSDLKQNSSNKKSSKDSVTSLSGRSLTASTKGKVTHCLLMGKTTRMLLATSVTYIVSYMTTITILLLTAATTLFDNPTLAEAVLINFFVLFYLINSVADPFIYSICNQNFRRDCVAIFKNCCIKYCKI